MSILMISDEWKKKTIWWTSISFYFEHEQQRANMLCNTLQNMKLKLSPDVQYRFTATCISNTGNRYSQVLSDFSQWIEFITTDSIQIAASRESSGLNNALNNIMNTINENVFDKNLFIILGSNQNLKINESLIARAGQKSASFLFVQTNRSHNTPYQDLSCKPNQHWMSCHAICEPYSQLHRGWQTGQTGTIQKPWNWRG